MTGNALLQLTLYVVVLIALAKPLGAYMAAVYEGRAPILGRLLGPVERLIYRVCGVRRRRRAALDDSMRSRCSPSTSSACWSCTACSGSRPICRSTRRRWPP